MIMVSTCQASEEDMRLQHCEAIRAICLEKQIFINITTGDKLLIEITSLVVDEEVDVDEVDVITTVDC